MTSSIDNLERPEKEQMWGTLNGRGEEFIFKNFTIDEVVKILIGYNQLKIEVDSSKILNASSSKINISLPKKCLESEELLGLKLKELGVEFERVEKEYWQYKIKN